MGTFLLPVQLPGVQQSALSKLEQGQHDDRSFYKQYDIKNDRAIPRL
jgi:hypothetical protein